MGGLLAAAAVGCAAAPPEPARTADAPTGSAFEVPADIGAADREAEAPVVAKLPTECAEADGDVCTPSTAFAENLCQSRKPDVALALFKKDTPWTRAWVRGPVEAWYASGGRSGKHKLKYAEEVLVVAKRAPRGGIQVSGSSSFDVVRWDGSCVSLMEGELSFRRPSTPDVAVIPWKHLDADIRAKLSGDQKIGFRNDKRIEACKEDRNGRKCEAAELGLSRMIADYVRGGGDVPKPKLLP